MHDLVNFVKIGQTAHYGESDFTQNRFWYGSNFLINVIE